MVVRVWPCLRSSSEAAEMDRRRADRAGESDRGPCPSPFPGTPGTHSLQIHCFLWILGKGSLPKGHKETSGAIAYICYIDHGDRDGRRGKDKAEAKNLRMKIQEIQL